MRCCCRLRDVFWFSIFLHIPSFFLSTCLQTANCCCRYKTCFLGCFFLSLSLQNTFLTTGNWFLWRQHFKNGILVLSSTTLWGNKAANCIGNGPPNCTFLSSKFYHCHSCYDLAIWNCGKCSVYCWELDVWHKPNSNMTFYLSLRVMLYFVARCSILNAQLQEATLLHTLSPEKQFLFN